MKVTSNISPFPKQKMLSSTTKDTLIKMLDLSEQINQYIDRVVDLKKEINEATMTLENEKEKTILEKFYVCFIT